ncbi:MULTISPECIES: ABC transporter permease [unclassified Ruminococcus]|uniref:ABC transporter permease n=1 Tax=unclassified Ruminococcus TaxID=2608920 RepID=UPI00210B88E6|nr:MULTISPECIES: ABC-2 family transporter protein [unclassified Ruminococcus]MCQ4022120.1 ABC transporter permease [Ruminococcus sp. zg-924]MCQ4114440.1 ABC transporter permease [Ruminococcus sp. zg-921]
MKDILSLFFAYAKSGLKTRFQYKLDAIVTTFAVFLREAAGIIAMYLALLKFDTINNWNINELMFLFSLIFITYGIFIVFFMALRDFSDWIKHGDIDRVMLRPRGILTQLVMCGADWLAALGHGTLGIVLFIISANSVGIEWNAVTIIYYIVTIASGVLIQGAVFLFFSAISIYFIETRSLKEIMYWNLRRFAGYPISIYNKLIQTLLIFVVPFAFVNYFPAQFLLRKPDMAAYPEWFMYISPFVGIVLYVIAYAFWKFSMRFYKSTGN